MVAPFEAFVGLFDFLGYRTLVANNTLPQLAELISAHLNRLPQMSSYIKMLNSPLYSRKIVDRLPNERLHPVEGYEWLIFSDTVLVIYRVKPEYGREIAMRRAEVRSFLVTCCGLLAEMFKAGFPMRGAVSGGQLFYDPPFIAGQAIVDAHLLEKIQSWSGCMVEKSFFPYIRSFLGANGYGLQTLARFSLPDVPSQIALRWPNYSPWEMPTLSDAAVEVHKQFSAHNKAVNDPKVNRKMENTVAFMNFCNSKICVEKTEHGSTRERREYAISEAELDALTHS